MIKINLKQKIEVLKNWNRFFRKILEDIDSFKLSAFDVINMNITSNKITEIIEGMF